MTVKEIDMTLDPIRGQVMNISRMLPTGAKFYTVEATEIDQNFEARRNEILANPKSPEFIANRSPRVIVVKDHTVFDQKFDVDIDGNSVVVFNKGTKEEAQATIVAGSTNFGLTTDEAMDDAIHGRSVRIFADGIKTATRANQLNAAELARVEQQIKYWTSKKDSIQSAIASNSKKVKEYQDLISKFKPDVDLTPGSVQVNIEA